MDSNSFTKRDFNSIDPPSQGKKIDVTDSILNVPNEPIIPLIIGDGIGPDVSAATTRVIDAAVEKAFGGNYHIHWFHLPAGETAKRHYGEYLPKETIDAIRFYIVSLKGPLITPVGGGFRSLNVYLRKELDLFACIRPSKWIPGTPSPVKNPEKMDVVIFRENTEDVYIGIEWEAGSAESLMIINFLKEKTGCQIREDSGLGIKSVSEYSSKRLIRAAINYALEHHRSSVTFVHKGNIMKYTEGAFRKWGYEVALSEFRNHVVTEEEVFKKSIDPSGKLIVKDRIADSMFQQVLLRPEEYDVIATTNLNGDYLSDACAAQVGGLGLAPGANINFESGIALFESTHGAAPKYANQDKVNPSSMILSGMMMLDYLGWSKASELITRALEKTIKAKTVTYDLQRQMEGSKLLKCSEFADAIIINMKSL